MRATKTTPTEGFLTPFLDHYNPKAPPKHPIVTGSYLPELEAAKVNTQVLWKNNFGTELPEHFAYSDDYLTREEREQAGDLNMRLFNSPPQHTQTLNEAIMKSAIDPRIQAARLRHAAYRNTLDFVNIQPTMRFTEPIERVPHVISPYLRNSQKEKTNAETTCTASVFGMNILHFIPGMDRKEFAPNQVESVVGRHPNTHHLSSYRLPDLLGLLGTAYATRRATAVVRSVTTIGCDFGEIEAKAIVPMRKRRPNVQCVINLVLASDLDPLANHVVAITDTSADCITLHDPKYKSPQRPTSRELFNRWISTNMQAVITFATPL